MSVLLHLVQWSLGLAPAEVWTTAAERECLARHAAGRTRLAELGVWHAGTTRRLREVMSADGVLFAIDPYPSGLLGFSAPRLIGRRELERVRNGRVVWVRSTGVEASRHPDIRTGAFDFVFIDAAQSYERLHEDWEAWAPLIATGGIVAIHDSRPDGPATQTSVQYANEVVLQDPRFVKVDAVDSLTVLSRTMWHASVRA